MNEKEVHICPILVRTVIWKDGKCTEKCDEDDCPIDTDEHTAHPIHLLFRPQHGCVKVDVIGPRKAIFSNSNRRFWFYKRCVADRKSPSEPAADRAK